MTTTTAPGATGNTTTPSKVQLLVTLAFYALNVWGFVHRFGDPFDWRAVVLGPIGLLIFFKLPYIRTMPGVPSVLLAALVLIFVLPDATSDAALFGINGAVTIGFPLAITGLFAAAFIATKRNAAAAGEEVEDRIVLGLSGYAGSGKDTAAEGLLEAGFTRVSFAEKLREVALAINPLIPVVVRGIGGEPDQQTYMRLDNYVDRLGWTEAKKNLEVRGLLQRIGTDAGRKVLGENVWVDAVMRELPTGHLVFTDMRFPNEYDAIMSQPGGVAVRINRPGVTAVNAHVSETALDGHLFHANIENSGSPTRVQTLLTEFLKAHTGHLL